MHYLLEIRAHYDRTDKTMIKAGLIGELKLALEATSRDWQVFLPNTHHTKVDMILMKPPGRPITVQVKKGCLQRQAKPHHAASWKVLIGSCKSSSTTSKAPRLNRYQVGDFDIMAVYIAELDVFAFYKLADIAGRSSMRWNERRSRRNNWELLQQHKQKTI